MLMSCRLKQPHVDVVLYKIDRLARDIYDYTFIRTYLRRHHVKLVSVVEPSDDSPTEQLLENIMAAMAEFYSANLSEETTKCLYMVLEPEAQSHESAIVPRFTLAFFTRAISLRRP